VTVAPGSVVELEVWDTSHVRLAAFSGSATLDWAQFPMIVVSPQRPFVAAPEPRAASARTPAASQRPEIKIAARRADGMTSPAAEAPTNAREREEPAQSQASDLALETGALRGALEKLSRGHDPQGALALLDDFLRHHQPTQLGDEIALARVQALAQLGRRSEALQVLDPLPLGRSQAIAIVLRGELRADADRCLDALNDFALADTERNDDVGARALYGRATCLARQGDSGRARLDFLRYLERFPQGRFAADAAHALGR
jgi:TolA-binding protein